MVSISQCLDTNVLGGRGGGDWFPYHHGNAYLHHSDVISAVDLCILGQFLPQGCHTSLQVFPLACILRVDVCLPHLLIFRPLLEGKRVERGGVSHTSVVPLLSNKNIQL